MGKDGLRILNSSRHRKTKSTAVHPPHRRAQTLRPFIISMKTGVLILRLYFLHENRATSTCIIPGYSGYTVEEFSKRQYSSKAKVELTQCVLNLVQLYTSYIQFKFSRFFGPRDSRDFDGSHADRSAPRTPAARRAAAASARGAAPPLLPG